MSNFITYQTQLAHLEDLQRQAAEGRRFSGSAVGRFAGRRRLVARARVLSLGLRPGVILRRVFSPPGLG